MGQLRFIADLHFGHNNVLAYDDREFKTIEEHDEALIMMWNRYVDIDDDVWLLGDFSWYNATKTLEILKRLNGTLHLCIGNHDHKLLRNQDIRKMFVEITDYKEIDLGNNYGLVLSHWPIVAFNHHYNGWTHFYGHVHNSWEWHIIERCRYESEELYQKPCDMINVGCMMPYMHYRPMTIEEIKNSYSAYKRTVS